MIRPMKPTTSPMISAVPIVLPDFDVFVSLGAREVVEVASEAVGDDPREVEVVEPAIAELSKDTV